MKVINTFVFLLILVSCETTDHRVKANFDFIEISHSNGWTGGTTVHIDSHGIIHKCKYRIISKIESAICCVDTLDAKIIDSLNVKVGRLKNQPIDTLYDGHCQDCGAYFIKAKYNEQLIRSMIIGDDEFDNAISNLAKYVTEIRIDENQMDSVLILETTKGMIPPPSPFSTDAIKFRPPIGK